MTETGTSKVVWLGYPGLLLFAIFAMASGSPGITVGEAVEQVLTGPLGFSGLSLGPLALVAMGPLNPRKGAAVVAGLVGIVLWVLLAAMGHGLATT